MSSGVRGPNSALTEFLRSQGISAANIRSRFEREQELEREAESLEQLNATRKSRRDGDSDDEGGSDDENRPELPRGTEFCAACQTRFTITIYSKRNEQGYLCVACSRSKDLSSEDDNANKLATKRRQLATEGLAARKQRRKIASALLDRKEASGATSMQDLCISLIAKYIDQVEALGDIGARNMTKISKILTRNRRLNDETVQLFFGPDVRTLELWDCSSLSDGTYRQLASFSPNIEQLIFSMCGQIHGDTLIYIAGQLKKLKKLELEGAFLVRLESWMEAFENLGNLESLAITNTFRFDSESLSYLVANVGENLTSLRLSRLSGLVESAGLYLLADLPNLRHFELSYPEPSVVTDEVMVTLINQWAPRLESLVLDGCSDLTDETINALEKCTNLTKLSISGLDKITSKAIAQLFDNTSFKGLHYLNFSRCIGLGDEALRNALVHSGPSLVELNINSLQFVTSEVLLETLPKCTNLTSINLGFVRGVNNKVIKTLENNCNHLRLLEVYGVPAVTCNLHKTSKATLIGKQNVDF